VHAIFIVARTSAIAVGMPTTIRVGKSIITKKGDDPATYSSMMLRRAAGSVAANFLAGADSLRSTSNAALTRGVTGRSRSQTKLDVGSLASSSRSFK